MNEWTNIHISNVKRHLHLIYLCSKHFFFTHWRNEFMTIDTDCYFALRKVRVFIRSVTSQKRKSNLCGNNTSEYPHGHRDVKERPRGELIMFIEISIYQRGKVFDIQKELSSFSISFPMLIINLFSVWQDFWFSLYLKLSNFYSLRLLSWYLQRAGHQHLYILICLDYSFHHLNIHCNLELYWIGLFEWMFLFLSISILPRWVDYSNVTSKLESNRSVDVFATAFKFRHCIITSNRIIKKMW